MDSERLVQVRLSGGRYEGILTAPTETGVEAVHHDKVVAVAHLTPEAGRSTSYRVALDLPAEIISEGVQVVGLRSTASGAILDRVTLLAGDALDEDVRAEIALLRDELEMLKRAFRRHCSETGPD